MVQQLSIGYPYFEILDLLLGILLYFNWSVTATCFFVFFQRPVLIFDALPSTALPPLLRRRHPTQVWNEGPPLNQSRSWNKRDSTLHAVQDVHAIGVVAFVSHLSRVNFVSFLCRMPFLGVVLAKRKWRCESRIEDRLSFGDSLGLIEFELLRYYYTVAVLL